MPRHVALVLFLLLGLAACAEDAPDGVRVQILTSAADGPVQGTLKIKSMDDGEGLEYPLRRVGTDEPPVYSAQGARSGKYRVLSDAGWGMLWTGTTGMAGPLLRPVPHPVTAVRLGKPRSLYVAAEDPAGPAGNVSAQWAADYKPAGVGTDQPFHVADLTIDDLGDGIVALRFLASEWQRGATLRVVGRMQDDSVSTLRSYAIRDADLFELPRLVLVHSAPQASLAVHLVPPPGTERVADGSSVQVRIAGIPLSATYVEETFQGVARFEELAALGAGLEVRIGSGKDTWTYGIDEETWRLRRSVHLVSLPKQGTLRVPLELPVDGLREVRARYGAVGDFGLVPFFSTTAGFEIVTHPGWQDLLLGYTDGTWVHATVFARLPPGNPAPMRRFGKPEKGCRVRGLARGAGALARVRFTLLLDEEAKNPLAPGPARMPARRASGEGFEAALSGDGAYEVAVPPGRYEIQLLTAGAPRGRARKLTLNPGAAVRLNLSPR